MAVPGFDPITLWVLILALGLGSTGSRSSFLLLFHWIDDIPQGAEDALRFIPPAVLAALILPRVVLADGAIAIAPGNDRLLAATVAAVVAWRTENILAVIGVGMGALWLFGWVG